MILDFSLISGKTNRIILDYVAILDSGKFGYLRFRDFLAVWHAADELGDAALDAGFDPEDIPGTCS